VPSLVEWSYKAAKMHPWKVTDDFPALSTLNMVNRRWFIEYFDVCQHSL